MKWSYGCIAVRVDALVKRSFGCITIRVDGLVKSSFSCIAIWAGRLVKWSFSCTTMRVNALVNWSFSSCIVIHVGAIGVTFTELNAAVVGPADVLVVAVGPDVSIANQATVAFVNTEAAVFVAADNAKQFERLKSRQVVVNGWLVHQEANRYEDQQHVAKIPMPHTSSATAIMIDFCDAFQFFGAIAKMSAGSCLELSNLLAEFVYYGYKYAIAS